MFRWVLVRDLDDLSLLDLSSLASLMPDGDPAK